MPVVVAWATKPGTQTLANFADTTIVRLRVADSGKFVIFGRVVIHNSDGDPQNAAARLATFDGATELDKVDVRIGGAGDADSLSLSLQGLMVLPDALNSNVIDLRCATFAGVAREASLFALSVDEIAGFN